MPLPSFVSATAPLSLNNTKSINRPAGIATGDALYAFVVCNYSDATITPPAGWTDVSALAFDESSLWSSERRVYRTVVGGGDGSSDSWKIDGQGGGNNFGAIAIVAYRDDAGVDVGDKNVGSGSAGSIATPTITTTGSSRKLIAFFDAAGDRTAVTASGMTSRAAGYVSADGADRTLAIFDEDFATAGATGTRTATLASATDVRYGGLLAIIGSGAHESITVTPNPTTAVVGGTRTATISRSSPAGAGGVSYNVTSSNSAVASVTTPQVMAEAATTKTFDITGVSVGSATITVTNAADSGETDSITINVSAPTTTTLKLLAHIDALGATAVKGTVFEPGTGGNLLGDEIGKFTGEAFETVAESGQAPLLIPVTAFGGGALTVSDTPVCVWEATSAAGSALGAGVTIGSVGPHECTVVEV
jgi:hypothetical protein